MEQPTYEVSSDDKLWAALAYPLSPLVPIILMLIEDKKDRLFIKAHNFQALVLGIISVILAITVVGVCISVPIFFYQLYLAYKTYQGELVEIPVITNFVKNQGWA
ncbi:MAG: hypothetical protein JXA19_06085 [Anaerolineales bacterium]|nr:hypothetical protein [Anaerolineales bacterium]